MLVYVGLITIVRFRDKLHSLKIFATFHTLIATFMSSSFPNATRNTEDYHNDMQSERPTLAGVNTCRPYCDLPGKHSSQGVSLANPPAIHLKASSENKTIRLGAHCVLLTNRYYSAIHSPEKSFSWDLKPPSRSPRAASANLDSQLKGLPVLIAELRLLRALEV